MDIKILEEKYHIFVRESTRLPGDINYSNEKSLILDSSGNKYIYKVYPDKEELRLAKEESRIINNIAGGLPFKLPVTLADNDAQFFVLDEKGEAKLLTYISGQFIAEIHHTPELLVDLGRNIALLDKAMMNIQSDIIRSRKLFWDVQHAAMSLEKVQFIVAPEIRNRVLYFLDRFEHYVLPQLSGLRHAFIHGDLNDYNILVNEEKITGFIDFGDMCYTPLINELAVSAAYLMFNKEDPFQAVVPLIAGYSEEISLLEKEVEMLPDLITARLCISLCNSAEKKTLGLADEYVLISEKNAEDLLKYWITQNPQRIRNLFFNAAGIKVKSGDKPKKEILAQRKKLTGKSLSLSYDEPIYMHSAAFQYMYDREGNTFLDAYNNIPHIGHSHPRISRAISDQIRQLNTNTRYLYDSFTAYIEKLLSYFPEQLNKVFIVNSGSEASDLATRMARTFTSRKQQLVLEHGYHGNTINGIDISSYKFGGRGGPGKPEHITVLPLPNLYNGICDTSEAYARQAIQIIADLVAKDTVPASFIAEPISGCGGQVPVAEGYFKAIKPTLEEHGIITIIDEVQTGFGRLGHFFWGFEMHGIVPDMVVLGKPMGNGHPVAAVVTTSEIAEAFATGMEFFSSFGGNPVSCEVARTVLEVIEEENLQDNAKNVGDYYIAKMKHLQKEFPSIGDIRGSGLFLGFEFVDPHTASPDTVLASKVKNDLRKNHILTSTDGPYDNVIKSKPPLCFSKRNVDRVLETFRTVLKSQM